MTHEATKESRFKVLKQAIDIEAPQRIVWESVVDPLKYERWTAVFAPGSRFEGGWNKGDAIRFFGPEAEGGQDGMFSEIAESIYPSYISIRHLGMIRGGVEDRTSEEASAWVSATENYTMTDMGGGITRFAVDMELEPEHIEMFNGLWADSLAVLKEISEEAAKQPVRITIRTAVRRSAQIVWKALTEPEHVKGWNHASPDWHCPAAVNDLTVGGRFSYTMAARSGEHSFEFSGTYTHVPPHESLRYVMDDGRTVTVAIRQAPGGVLVEETFEAEGVNSLVLQRNGWQSILNELAVYTEAHF